MEEFYDQHFDEADKPLPLTKGNYEACVFAHVDFSGVNLSGFRFVDCRFAHCIFRLTLLGGTVLNNVGFDDCLLQGLRFGDASAFGLQLRFQRCQLNQLSFESISLPGLTANHNSFSGVDFSGADFSKADLRHNEFHQCLFGQTRLEKADLRGSTGLVLDIGSNYLKKAKVELQQLPGLMQAFGLEIG